jgi:hypothetical protein
MFDYTQMSDELDMAAQTGLLRRAVNSIPKTAVVDVTRDPITGEDIVLVNGKAKPAVNEIIRYAELHEVLEFINEHKRPSLAKGAALALRNRPVETPDFF